MQKTNKEMKERNLNLWGGVIFQVWICHETNSSILTVYSNAFRHDQFLFVGEGFYSGKRHGCFQTKLWLVIHCHSCTNNNRRGADSLVGQKKSFFRWMVRIVRLEKWSKDRQTNRQNNYTNRTERQTNEVTDK
jgi:hypothetical protein